MGMMDKLKKRIKGAARVAADVMNSPCCDEDEGAGEDQHQPTKRRIKG